MQLRHQILKGKCNRAITRFPTLPTNTATWRLLVAPAVMCKFTVNAASLI